MNWTEALVSETDVFIQVNTGKLIVSFSTFPDPKVLDDLCKLNDKPGFSIERYGSSGVDFLVLKPVTYAPVVVAQGIQRMLESHGLKAEITSKFN